jgi:hypothetical protein
VLNDHCHRVTTQLQLINVIIIIYYFLRLFSPVRTMASSTGFLDHTQRHAKSVGLLWTSNQLVAETSTWQHTTHKTDKHRCPRWDPNHDRSRRAALDLRLRPRGHWDRHGQRIASLNNTLENDKRKVGTPNNELIIQVVWIHECSNDFIVSSFLKLGTPAS